MCFANTKYKDVREMEPRSIYAINANIVTITKSGKLKLTIQLDNNAGTAIDRVRQCYDYDDYNVMKGYGNVFNDDFNYLAYSIHGKDQEASFILTCRCSVSDLSKEESYEWVAKGMDAARMKLESLT